MTAPKIIDVAVYDPATNKIRVVFDQSMAQDSTFFDSANWEVDGSPSQEVIADKAEAAIVTLASEMQTAATLTLQVFNITNEAAEVIDPAFDEFSFTGQGVAPTVANISTPTSTTITVTFSENMNVLDYVFASYYDVQNGVGAHKVQILNVSVLDSDAVTIQLNAEMTDGGSYTLTINGSVRDLAGNPMSTTIPALSFPFSGMGSLPQVASATYAVDGTLIVEFNEDMYEDGALTSRLSYLIEPTTPGAAACYVKSVKRISARKVALTISEATDGVTYEVAADGLRDIAFNDLDPLAVSTTFVGQGTTPKVSLVRAIGPNRVDVVFSEPMLDSPSLRDPARYVFDNGLTTISAMPDKADSRIVQLVTSTWLPDVEYSLTIDAS